MPKRNKIRMQVPVDTQAWESLVDWAAEVKKDIQSDVGVGTISAMLLEELVKRPDLIQEFLFSPQTTAKTTDPPGKLGKAPIPIEEKKANAGKRAA